MKIFLLLITGAVLLTTVNVRAGDRSCAEEVYRLEAENAKLITEVVRLRALEYNRAKRVKEERRRTLREANQSLRELEQLKRNGRRLME